MTVIPSAPVGVRDQAAMGHPRSGLGGQRWAGAGIIAGGIFLGIAVLYLAHLSRGHVFNADDFAAYVMHAENLAEHRPYTEIHYVPNPDAPWLAPSNGYPPVYPAILAPVYRIWGLNLRAMKIATVLCFLFFLVIFALLAHSRLSWLETLATILIVSSSPVFWDQRDYLLSEFPYLMFSFAALLLIQRTYHNLAASDFRMGSALPLSALLYCAYGTRTIGIVLIAALVLADLCKFKRPSRFLVAVILCTTALILLQTGFLTSPAGYISAVHFSLHSAAANFVYYGKVLSYAWQNGYSKIAQIGFTVVFTALAAMGFLKNLIKERSAQEFYLLGYIAVLVLWSAEIGMRGLLPVLPLYFVYGVQGLRDISARIWPRLPNATVAFVLFLAAVIYGGEFRAEARLPAEANVQDPVAQDLFSFVRMHTEPEETLLFVKPRSLVLFTGRNVASLDSSQSATRAARFVRGVHATVLVEADWGPSWHGLLKDGGIRVTEVFRNSAYKAFRLE